MVLRFLNSPTQRHNLLLRQMGNTSHTFRVKTISKHILGSSSNANANTFLFYIPHAGSIIILIHHSSLPFSKLNAIKIRNSRYLKNLLQLLFPKIFGNVLQLMTVFKRIKKLIHNGLAFALGFLKSWQNNENHTEYIVANFGVQVVPHRQILHSFRAALTKVKVKIHNAYGIKLRQIKIVVLTFFCKITDYHAKIEERPANKMLLPTNLNFHNEPIPAFVLARDIKDGTPVAPCFPLHFVSNESHLFNGRFEFFCEKSVQKKQKQILASLAGESFFESEVKRKRSELVLLTFEAGSASLGFWHNMPPNKNSYNKIAPLAENIEKNWRLDRT